MNRYEMIVLAVSPSEGGVCLAGITPEGKFIRPVFLDEKRNSYSFPREFIESKGIKLFSLIEFWGNPNPMPYHPEDIEIKNLEDIKVIYKHYYSWKRFVENLALSIDDFEDYLKTKSFVDNKVLADGYNGNSIFLLKVPKGTKIAVRPHRSWEKPFSKEAFLILPERKIKVTAPINIWYKLPSYVDLRFTKDSYALITLGRPFKDGYCYLLVSGILTEYPHAELFTFDVYDPRHR